MCCHILWLSHKFLTVSHLVKANGVHLVWESSAGVAFDRMHDDIPLLGVEPPGRPQQCKNITTQIMMSKNVVLLFPAENCGFECVSMATTAGQGQRSKIELDSYKCCFQLWHKLRLVISCLSHFSSGTLRSPSANHMVSCFWNRSGPDPIQFERDQSGTRDAYWWYFHESCRLSPQICVTQPDKPMPGKKEAKYATVVCSEYIFCQTWVVTERIIVLEVSGSQK